MPEEETTIEPITEPTPEPVPIESPIVRAKIKEDINDMIQELLPLIRQEDIAEIRSMSDTSQLIDIIKYLGDNIPEVREYICSISLDSSDGEKVKAIKDGLRRRAESMVPDYEMPPPFLGNEVEEARSKQEDASTRYSTQYGRVPFVKPVFRGRSAVDNPYYEPRKSSIETRFRQ